MAKKWISDVYLEEIEHKYHHKTTGKKYKSVTGIISLIEPHFDSLGIATAIVNQPDETKNPVYIGMDLNQILDHWRYLNDTANAYGTHVHETLETYLLKNKWWYPSEPLQQKVIAGYEALKIDEGKEMWAERIMFAEEYELAGTSDLVIDIDDVFFDICDYKGLSIDTPIFTDSGWKTMETVSKSDKIYDMNGNLTKILHLSEIKNKLCYKITFDNGETIIADFEHRWLVSFHRNNVFKDVVMTSEEIYHYLNELNSSNKRWAYKLPKIKISKPLNNRDISLPIDPYVLGVWLGDGNSIDNKITNMNDDVWLEIENRGYKIGQDVSGGAAGKAETRTIHGLRSKLNNLNLLSNKHLPDVYLLSSYNQRLDLLRGFMDSDGYYNKIRKRFVMATTRKWQVDAFVKLLSSLGIKATVISGKKKCNGKYFDGFDVCFSTLSLNPFLCRNKEGIEYGKQNNRDFKNIVSVDVVESVPTRCIEVESETHTFLYGHTFSVTHNTNKEINYFNKYGNGTLLKPVDHLQNCQYSIYALQLSIYAMMYQMEFPKRKCRQIIILHWDKEKELFTKIPVVYLKHEAKQIMELYKYKSLLSV